MNTVTRLRLDGQIVPVILASGAGNRLWPLSREQFPKQLLTLLGDSTLIQDTALRHSDRSRFTEPLVVTSEAIRFTVAEQLQSVGVTPSTVILDPIGRETAPLIAVPALLAQAADPDTIILVAPSGEAHHRETRLKALTAKACKARGALDRS